MSEIIKPHPDNSHLPAHETEGKELLRERFQATLLGGAIGDALGMPVEGWDREQIRRHVGVITEPVDPIIIKDDVGNVVHRDETGRIPYVSPYAQKGEWTDDTWLSVATARSIVSVGGLDLTDQAAQSLAIYDEQLKKQTERTPQGIPIAAFLHPDSEVPQPFGGTTVAAFENLKKGIPPTESGVMSRNPGNAPAIKIAPVGMYMHATGKYDEGLQFAEDLGKMTHLDPRSIASGVVQAHAIYALLDTVSRTGFMDSVIDVCSAWEKSKEQGKKVTLLDRLQWVGQNRDVHEETAYQKIGIGWPVTKNYPFTLFMFQKYWDDPEEGLLRTVNYGGDCDSTAAIFGALAGAKNGIFFPENWTTSLENPGELITLADSIYNLRNSPPPKTS